MNNALDLNSLYGKVSIPVCKITGICEPGPASKASGFNCFVATGPDGPDGEENGWYVIDDYDTVRKMLEYHLDT
jgi:hypothetical protein